MSRAIAPLALAMCLSHAGAAAEMPPPESASEAAGLASFWGSYRVGVVEAPYPSEAFPEVRSEAGQASVWRFGAALRIAQPTWIGFATAYATPGVEQPAGSYRTATAWGNALLFIEQRRAHELGARAPELEARLRLGIGAPLAERGQRSEQLEQRALAIADALHGFGQSELFTPEVVAGVIGATLVLHSDSHRASVALKLPALVRVSNNSVPERSHAASVGFVPSTEARATSWPFEWLGLSLGATVAWRVVPPVRIDGPRESPALMIAPRMLFAIGSRLRIATDVDVAAAGPLAGTASAALGLRVSAD